MDNRQTKDTNTLGGTGYEPSPSHPSQPNSYCLHKPALSYGELCNVSGWFVSTFLYTSVFLKLVPGVSRSLLHDLFNLHSVLVTLSSLLTWSSYVSLVFSSLL